MQINKEIKCLSLLWSSFNTNDPGIIGKSIKVKLYAKNKMDKKIITV